MKCLSSSEIHSVSKSHLADFQRDLESIPSNMCVPFHNAAQRLEDHLLFIHRLVVEATKKEEDLQAVAEWWGGMVVVCDLFAAALGKLKTEHPYCGADIYYDNVLDVRNRCQRLQNLHS